MSFESYTKEKLYNIVFICPKQYNKNPSNDHRFRSIRLFVRKIVLSITIIVSFN